MNYTAITAEVARATAAEGVNYTAITAEVARATAAEGVNYTAITAEVARATAAEGVNYTAITAEVARATAAEGVITGDVAALQGLTSGYNKAMSDGVTATSALVNVWSAPGITPSTNLLVNTATIQAKNAAGGNLAQFRVLHIWISETDLGAASTNNIETLVLSTGSAVSTVTANADYWYCTAAAGSAVATITATAAGTNWLMVADGASISSEAIVFE